MLKVEKLSHSFKQFDALKCVSMEVARGEIVGLLGANGAGKTTSFALMVGLLPVKQGKILLDRKDITKWNIVRRAREGIIYMPQEGSIFSKLTVRQNILAVLEFYPELFKKRREILDHVCDQMHLGDVMDRKAGVLSGGERRRLEIARALSLSPKFLLLDEPFAAIDPISVGEVKEIIRKLVGLNIGILVTDHNVRDTLKVCHRAYLLNAGRIIESGSPDQICQSELARRHYLGETFEM